MTNDDESQALKTPIFQPYLGNKPPEVIFPKQIDCESYRNLLNHFHVEYARASEVCKAQGDDKQASHYSGVCAGLRLAWEQSYQLERFGV